MNEQTEFNAAATENLSSGSQVPSKMATLRILMVEDLVTDAELAERELRSAELSFIMTRVETAEEFIHCLESFAPDIVLSDYCLPCFNGMAALQLTQKLRPATPLIIITGSINEETAVACMKAGASDYVLKDRLSRLGPAVLSACEKALLHREKETALSALRASEERFRTAFDNAAFGMALGDLDGRFIRVNRVFSEMLGYPEEQLAAMTFAAVTHPEDVNSSWQMARALLDGEETICHYEERYLAREGRIIWAEVGLFLLRDPEDKPLYFVAHIQDITERKRIAAELQRSRDFYLTLFEEFPAIIWRAGVDGKLNYFNKTSLDFSGLSFAEALNDGWMQAAHPEDLTRYLRSYLEAFSRRELFQVVFRLRHRSGEFRWVITIGKPFYDLDGRFAGYIGSCIDIDERISAEERVRASLQEKEVLLKEIHHRVKNNLQVISSLLSLQAGSSQDPGTLRLLRESQTRVTTMALIHEKLYQSADLAQIDFRYYVRSLAEYLYTTYGIDPERIRLRLDMEEIYLGIGTAIPCGLIINELMSNALKHAFPGEKEGEIYLGLHKEETGELALVVRDNGIGLPDGFDLPHAQTLGMELVSSLVNQLDGRMVWSTSNGTYIQILIPASPVALN